MSSVDDDSELEKCLSEEADDSTIQELPTELLIPIFKVLNVSEKRNARLVCQRWRCILDHPESKLVNFNARINGANLEKVLDSGLSFDSVTIGNVKKSFWPDGTNQTTFARTQSIILRKGNYNKIIMHVLKYGCDNMEDLKLNRYSLGNVNTVELSSLLTEKKWEFLSDLSFNLAILNPSSIGQTEQLCKWQENHIDAVEYFMKMAISPKLRAIGFHIKSDYWVLKYLPTKKMIIAFTEFLERHTKTLRQVSLAIDLIQPFNEGFVREPNFIIPIFEKERQDPIARALKIENFCLQTSNFDIHPYLVPPCLWELNTLTKFSWVPIYGSLRCDWAAADISLLRDLIQRNCTTLIDANVQFISHLYDPNQFCLTWLEDCPKLRKLSLDYDRQLCDSNLGQYPSVTKLKLTSRISISNNGDWIAQAFPNLKTIDIRLSWLITANLIWLESLLSLEQLVEIRYNSLEDENEELDNFVRDEFVKKKHGLELMTGVKGKMGTYGLIKITPAFRLRLLN